MECYGSSSAPRARNGSARPLRWRRAGGARARRSEPGTADAEVTANLDWHHISRCDKGHKEAPTLVGSSRLCGAGGNGRFNGIGY